MNFYAEPSMNRALAIATPDSPVVSANCALNTAAMAAFGWTLSGGASTGTTWSITCCATSSASLGCGVRLVRGKRALQRWTVLGRERRHVRELRVHDEARLDAAWLHTRDVRTERPEQRCLRLRESFNRELGGAIHIVELLAPDAAHPADDDDLARALLTHGSQDGLLASNHTEHVRVELCLYRNHAELLNRAKDGVPCVVDELTGLSEFDVILEDKLSMTENKATHSGRSRPCGQPSVPQQSYDWATGVSNGKGKNLTQ